MESKKTPIEIEPVEREKIDLDTTAPKKAEKEQAPEEEVTKVPYKRAQKELTQDELDTAELVIPKVQVTLFYNSNQIQNDNSNQIQNNVPEGLTNF